MKETSKEIRSKLTSACDDLTQSIEELKIFCGIDNWAEKTVHITEEFTEIFPNVLAKVVFPKRKNKTKTIILKAKAGSKLDPHKMLPLRFVYIMAGDQRNERGIIVLNEDEGMTIKPFEESSMYFGVDTKLLMEIDE